MKKVVDQMVKMGEQVFNTGARNCEKLPKLLIQRYVLSILHMFDEAFFSKI